MSVYTSTSRKYSYLFLFFICFSSCDIDDGLDSGPYSFFVAGHTYGKPRVDNVGFHPPFKKKFNLINNDMSIEFGVLTGDIVKTSTEKNWNEIDQDLNLIIHPVYFSVGNHDIDNLELYLSRYGNTYKSFIHNSDLFIILDPNIDKWNISGDQLLFLKSTLEKNHFNVDNIFVFFHQLLWWDEDNLYKNVKMNSTDGRADSINFWNEIIPLFISIKNKIYMFAGDVGAFNNGSEFMYHSYSNITFIASGMGGEVRDNIVFVDINEDKTVSFRLIALNGDNINSLGSLTDYELP